MMNEKFRISVIIPTYNRSRGMEHTLRSLTDQKLDRSEFEIIVVDDGSSDDTFDVVKNYQDKINLIYAYQPDKGYRPSSARNIGIRAARGKICLFIDSGIIAKSDCLQKHIDIHARIGKDIAVVGNTYGYTQHGETEDELISLVDPDNADLSIAMLTEKQKFQDIRLEIYEKYDNKLNTMAASWTLFWGGHLSVAKTVLMEIGGFDENYDGNWGCEDNDLGYRLLKENVEVFLCREAQVLHLPHGTNLNLKKKEGFKNCKYFHNKFSTAETKIFLSYYLKEITGVEVIDFTSLFIQSQAQSIA